MTHSISIRLTQTEINETMRPLIERKLHEQGVNVIDGVKQADRYIMMLVDPPVAVNGTDIEHQVDRNDGSAKLTYVIRE